MNRRDRAIIWTLGPAFVLSVCGVLVASWLRMDGAVPRLREVRLETRCTTFVRAEGDGREQNPTIEASAGERIRIVVRNSDVGVVTRSPFRSWVRRRECCGPESRWLWRLPRQSRVRTSMCARTTFP